MTTADDNLAELAMARPARRLSREWWLVRAGIAWMRASVIVLLPVACVSALLALVVDRADQPRFLIIFGGAHLVIAIPQFVGLLLCCCAPEGTATRRQARLTRWLVVTAVGFVGAFAATILILRSQSVPWDFLSVWAQLFLISVLSLYVNFALIGFTWLRIHVALGRDLIDPLSCGRAHNVVAAWIAFSALSGSLFALYSFDVPGLPHGCDSLAWIAMMLAALEVFYLRLLNRIWRALRASMDDSTIWDDEAPPSGPIPGIVEHTATAAYTRI